MKNDIVLECIITVIVLQVSGITNLVGPSLHEKDATTCDEFSRFARFNPYSVTDSEWMVFYYWGPTQSPMFVKFIQPTEHQKAYLKYVLQGHVLEPVNWTARHVLMKERDNRTYLLVERNDRGHYFLYEPYRDMKEGYIVDAVDIRIRQTGGDTQLIGIMDCAANTVFLLSRVAEVPKKKMIQEVAARFGYRGRGGKSYLYQGHHWMPIPEADDEHFQWSMENKERLK